MPNLCALLRSKGILFVFGITYHLGKEMRLKRLKIKTRHFHKQRENKLKNYYKHEKIHHTQR